jgi:hypothetical protein
MKKNILLLTLILFSTISFSQDKHEQIQALKVALITEEMNLSEIEAQKFWPIYNAFEDKNIQLRKDSREKRKSIDFETISDSEAKTLLKELNVMSNKKNDIHNKYISDLQKVLPAKKVLLLKKAENEFKHKMFEEFKKRKRKRP